MAQEQSLRSAFKAELANSILSDIQFQKDSYYYFLGGVEPWNGFEGDTAGDVPTDPLNQDDATNRRYRSEMVFTKKISPSDVSLAIPRIDWTSGTVYDQWDHTVDMLGKQFYVLTEDFNVYKCLYNHQGSPSTVKPYGTFFTPIETADGYIWKYLYNIPAFKRSKFLSVTTMPVQKALTEGFYSNGQIEGVTVLEEGDGYTLTPLTSITVDDTGCTTGSGASATATIDPITGEIISVSVDTPGSGYTAGVNVVAVGIGQGAVLEAVIVAGTVSAVNVIRGGYGYDTTGTNIDFRLGGATFSPQISRVDGSIYRVDITNPGVGYVSPPALEVVEDPGVPNLGTGKFGNPRASVEAIVYDGSVQLVAITDPGINYAYDNSTTITVVGDGSGAKMIPVIENNKFVDAVVEERGSGYSDAAAIIVSSTGSGAIVRPIISQSDFVSDQMVVEQTAVEGAIHAIQVTAVGENYTTDTYVTVTGNGSGCEAYPEIINGRVERIHISNPGSGYTFASVTITDPGRPVVTVPASAYPILPPLGGHGSNAPAELFANTLSISTSLRGELEVENIIQEFRTFGMIKNPRSILTNTPYRNDSSLLAYTVQLADSIGLEKDDVLFLDDIEMNKFRVLDISGTSVKLLPLDRTAVDPIGTLVSVNTGLTYNSKAILGAPDFNKYSGSLVYISTESPFVFSSDQSITIKTYIGF